MAKFNSGKKSSSYIKAITTGKKISKSLLNRNVRVYGNKSKNSK